MLGHALILSIELWKSLSYQWHKVQLADKIQRDSSLVEGDVLCTTKSRITEIRLKLKSECYSSGADKKCQYINVVGISRV